VIDLFFARSFLATIMGIFIKIAGSLGSSTGSPHSFGFKASRTVENNEGGKSSKPESAKF
jgi:hypothetical protein